jgi:hypothetical protein
LLPQPQNRICKHLKPTPKQKTNLTTHHHHSLAAPPLSPNSITTIPFCQAIFHLTTLPLPINQTASTAIQIPNPNRPHLNHGFITKLITVHSSYHSTQTTKSTNHHFNSRTKPIAPSLLHHFTIPSSIITTQPAAPCSPNRRKALLCRAAVVLQLPNCCRRCTRKQTEMKKEESYTGQNKKSKKEGEGTGQKEKKSIRPEKKRTQNQPSHGVDLHTHSTSVPHRRKDPAACTDHSRRLDRRHASINHPASLLSDALSLF